MSIKEPTNRRDDLDVASILLGVGGIESNKILDLVYTSTVVIKNRVTASIESLSDG